MVCFICIKGEETLNLRRGENIMGRKEIKRKYVVMYLSLFLVAGILFLIRCLNYLDIGAKVLPDFILLHVTNFSLSLMFMLAFGFTVLVFGGEITIIRIAGLLIIVFNLIYEVFLPILNVPDIIDALFGLCGVIVAYVFLYILNKDGVIRK